MFAAVFRPFIRPYDITARDLATAKFIFRFLTRHITLFTELNRTTIYFPWVQQSNSEQSHWWAAASLQEISESHPIDCREFTQPGLYQTTNYPEVSTVKPTLHVNFLSAVVTLVTMASTLANGAVNRYRSLCPQRCSAAVPAVAAADGRPSI